MKIRFVHKNHCFARSFLDKISQLILGRDAGRGIVWVTDVNQTSLGGSKHFGKIVGEAAGQRDLYNLGTISGGVLKNRFERWICRHKLSVLRSSKCFCAEF